MTYAAKIVAPAAIAIAAAFAPLAASAMSNPNPDTNTPTAKPDIRRINQIARAMPQVSPGVASGATATCADGSISRNPDPIGACMYRGGVDRWFGPQPERGIDSDGTMMAATRG